MKQKIYYHEVWTTENVWEEQSYTFFSPELALSDALERNQATGECVRVCVLDDCAPCGFHCLATFGSFTKDFYAYVYVGSEPLRCGMYSTFKGALRALRETCYSNVSIYDRENALYYFYKRKKGGRFKRYMIYDPYRNLSVRF